MLLGQKLSSGNCTLEKVFPLRSTDTDDNSRQKQIKSVVSEQTPVKSAEDQIPAHKEESSGQELPAQNLQMRY
jgi:hypothetical protein